MICGKSLTWPRIDWMWCDILTSPWHPDRCSRLPLRSTLRTCWWLPQINHVKSRMYQAWTRRMCSIHHGFMTGWWSRPELLRCVHPLVVARPMWPCWRFWTWWISSAWRHFVMNKLRIVALDWHCMASVEYRNLQNSSVPLCLWNLWQGRFLWPGWFQDRLRCSNEGEGLGMSRLPAGHGWVAWVTSTLRSPRPHPRLYLYTLYRSKSSVLSSLFFLFFWGFP